jgi:4'-phosphopantetheinyl transferase EntD
MWSGLLPDGVVTEWGDPAAGAAPLLEEEAPYVERAVEKRRAEFAKGRECARRALSRLGLEATMALHVGPSREPLWPERVVGSITHTQGHCAAAVGWAQGYLGIGIDVELELPLPDELIARVCSSIERQRLDSLGELPPGVAARLIFSAKEAVYKCQFPSTQAFLGFMDVALRVDPAGSFEVEVLTTRVPSLGSRRMFGRWRRAHGFLFATAWMTRA